MSERLASLGFIVAQLRAPLKPLEHHNSMILMGLMEASIESTIMPADASPSDCRSKFLHSDIYLYYR